MDRDDFGIRTLRRFSLMSFSDFERTSSLSPVALHRYFEWTVDCGQVLECCGALECGVLTEEFTAVLVAVHEREYDKMGALREVGIESEEQEGVLLLREHAEVGRREERDRLRLAMSRRGHLRVRSALHLL